MGNLPPVEPRNLRRNRGSGEGNYQNQGPNYPPPNDDYPPRQSGSQYPPPDDRYPPAERDGYVDLDGPQFAGQQRRSTRDRQPHRDDPYSAPSPSLNPIDTPTLGGGRSARGRDYDDDDYDDFDEPPRRRRPRRSQGLSERQVEYLAWGSTILLLGVSMLQAITGSSGFLRFLFPLLAGLILSSSAIYQRVVRGWHVGPFTWLIAGLLVSYTITLQVAGDGTGIFKWIAYFIGTLIIMTGLLLILQIFRQH